MYNIAIDGPAGAGKSTIAKMAAKKLDFIYVDTGASMMTSNTSKYPAVREKLLYLQRELAAANNVIMDGRDIGTCVLPDAELKIYLTASASERAKRRYLEQKERGVESDLAQIERDIIARDEQDMNREIAPLKQAEDAIYLDTSDMTIEEVVTKIVSLVQKA